MHSMVFAFTEEDSFCSSTEETVLPPPARENTHTHHMGGYYIQCVPVLETMSLFCYHASPTALLIVLHLDRWSLHLPFLYFCSWTTDFISKYKLAPHKMISLYPSYVDKWTKCKSQQKSSLAPSFQVSQLWSWAWKEEIRLALCWVASTLGKYILGVGPYTCWPGREIWPKQ